MAQQVKALAAFLAPESIPRTPWQKESTNPLL